MGSSVDTGDATSIGDVTASGNQAVQTGGLVDACPVYATLIFQDGTPSVSNLFYIDETGILQTVSSGQAFTKAAALKPAIESACLWLNDAINETARQAFRITATTCDTDGNITGTTITWTDLQGNAITPAGTEVASKEEQCFSLGQESVAVADPFAGLAVPAGANGAHVQVDPDSNAIRYTFDGSTPDDNSFGASPGTWITICKAADLAGFRAVSAESDGTVDAALGAQLQVSYVSTELHN